jgi:hypothetical protein
MRFSFLEKYLVPAEFVDEQRAKEIGRLRHFFYALPDYHIEAALSAFKPFPEELRAFYYEIGFGFMLRAKRGKFNTLFDPLTLIYTNNQINYFATTETVDERNCYDNTAQLLFFKTASNHFLTIDRNTVQGKNAVYYKGDSINDSLYDFLKSVHNDRDYLSALLDYRNYKMEKAAQKQEMKNQAGNNSSAVKNDYASSENKSETLSSSSMQPEQTPPAGQEVSQAEPAQDSQQSDKKRTWSTLLDDDGIVIG